MPIKFKYIYIFKYTHTHTHTQSPFQWIQIAMITQAESNMLGIKYRICGFNFYLSLSFILSILFLLIFEGGIGGSE